MLKPALQDETQWDAFVLASGGGFLQSWGWSQFQERLGRRVYRYRIDEQGESGDGSTVVQFLLIHHPLPLGKKFAYIPRGPLIKTDGKSLERLDTFLGALRETIRRESAVFGRIDFPFAAAGGGFGAGELIGRGLIKVKSVQPADTLIIDLKKSEEELMAEMHPKTRYNIGLAARYGVLIREANYENGHLRRHDIDVLWSLLEETAGRDKFHTHPKEYYMAMLDALSPKKSDGISCRLMFAEYKDRPIASGIFVEFGDTVTYLHGATASAYRSVMSPYLLHWSMIKNAKRDGFANYDFWGIAPPDDPEHPWAGMTRFKTGFGGRRVSYVGAWELPADWFWYTLYRWAKRFRNI